MMAPEATDDDLLRAVLREDVPHGDLTTAALGIGTDAGVIVFHARGAMTACGIEFAARLFEIAGARVTAATASGTTVASDSVLLRADGPAAVLHAAWKTAQTLAESLSGIATATRGIVDAVAAAGCTIPVACTRKNFPGVRRWSALAVRAGGGVMHRLGLSETLLVFPEHLAFVPQPERAARLDQLRRQQPEKRIVVEVGSIAEAQACARAGADVLQLERFTPAQLADLRATLAREGLAPALAPAGGVNAANAADYARARAAFLVTSAPYFAPPRDIRVSLGPADRGPRVIPAPRASRQSTRGRRRGRRGAGARRR